MTIEKYWPGTLTWEELARTISAWSDGPITRDEAYEVMQVASVLGIFGFPEGSEFREEKRVSEQVQLVADILNGLVQAIPPLLPHYDAFGLVNLGKCRYCGAIGEVHSVSQVRHEHTDECVLSLNAKLQASLQSVLASHNTEGQE